MNISLHESEQSFFEQLPLVRHIVRSFHIYGPASDEIVLETFLKAFDARASIPAHLNFETFLASTARILCLQAVRNQKPPVPEELPELGAPLNFWFDKDTSCSDVQLEFNSVFVSALLLHYPLEPRRTIVARYYLEAKSLSDIVRELKLSSGRVLQELLQFRIDLKQSLIEMRGELPHEPKKPNHLRAI